MATSLTRTSFVRTRDGLRLAVEEAGCRSAPTVVFVHGYAQSRTIWRRALLGPLASRLHLISFDLRGHGDSEAPATNHASTEWLGVDLEAVIDSLGGPPPIVAPWSYGGVAVGEYLRRGGRRLSGLFLVAASNAIGRSARPLFGPVMLDHSRALLSADAATYMAGARAFLARCAATPLPSEAADDALAEMLRVSAPVRSALLSRDQDYAQDLAACGLPIATLHGRRDPVVLPAMSERILALVPAARSTWLDDVGHLPWLEAPQAFESELLSFASRCSRLTTTEREPQLAPR